MKTFVAVLITFSTAVSLSAQGLVNFANTPTTLVSAEALQFNGPISVMSGPPGSYYFGLFLGGGVNSYTFTGLYATNTGFDGLFSGGTVAVPGWAPGTTQSYFVAGWSAANMGHDFNPIWFTSIGFGGDFGFTHPSSGVAGDGGSIPTLDLFGPNVSPPQGGFVLLNRLVPEPSTAAMLSVGIGLILFNRMRKKNQKQPLNIHNENPSSCSRCRLSRIGT